MLQAISQPIDDEISDGVEDGGVAQPSLDAARPTLAMAERYGTGSRPNIPVIAIIAIIHALTIACLIQLRSHVLHVQEAKLTVVNLNPTPPPPVDEAPPPPMPKVVTPPPIVQAPVRPVQVVQTSPVPVVASVPSVALAPSPVPLSVVSSPSPDTVQASELGTQMISGKPPRYPLDSRRKREQGTVVLALTLSVDGAVESVTIAQSSGFARLDNAARDAVKDWRWKPTLRGGQPVRVKGLVDIPFILRTDAA